MSILDNLDLSDIQIDVDAIDISDTVQEKSIIVKKDLSKVVSEKLSATVSNVTYFNGLLALLPPKSEVRTPLLAMRNILVQKFWLAKYEYHKEFVSQQFYGAGAQSRGTLQTLVDINKPQLESLKNIMSTLSPHSSEYKDWETRVKNLHETVHFAQLQIKAMEKTESSTWEPPTFDDIKEVAKRDNLFYSDAVEKFEIEQKHAHLDPDWVIEFGKYFNAVDRMTDLSAPIDPREPKYIRATRKHITDNYNRDNHATMMFKALENYWDVVTSGILKMEDNFLEQTIVNFVDGIEDYSIWHTDQDQAVPMEGFFSDLFKVVMTPARIFAEVTVKTMNATIGKVIPKKFYGRLEGLSQAQINVLEGKLKKEDFQFAIEQVKDIALVPLKLNQKAQSSFMKTKIGMAVNQYTGGLVGAVYTLTTTSLTLAEDPINGYKRVDWEATIYSAAMVAMAIISGGTAVAVMAAMNAAGDMTGLDQTSWGRVCMQAGRIYMSGGSASIGQMAGDYARQQAVKESQGYLTKQSSLARTSIGRSLVGAGGSYTMGGQEAMNAYVKKLGVERSKEVVGDKTGLADSAFGKSILDVGAAYGTGGAQSARTIAQQQAINQTAKSTTRIANKALPVRSDLTKEYINGSLAGLGKDGVFKGIDGNPSFSEKMKQVAKEKAEEVAKKRAEQILRDNTKGIVGLDELEKAYSLKDKSIEDIVAEAQRKFQERANMGYAKEKLNAEMDRFIEKRISEAHGLPDKYGKKFLQYLIAKYGPQYDYDVFLTPYDFLSFQLWQPPAAGQRLMQYNYSRPFGGRKGKTWLLVAVAVAGTTVAVVV